MDHRAEPPSEHDLLRWSETLSALARTGLAFTDNLYERERFEEVLSVAADIRTKAETPYDTETLLSEWTKTVGQGIPGYVTPKATVAALVGNDDGELLMVQRADSGIWLYPTGWADVGYSPAEVAVKEVQEEAGLETEVVRLVGVMDGLRLGFTRIPLYSIIFHLRVTGGELRPHPLECRDVGFFAEDALPEPVADPERWKRLAFAAVRGEPIDPYFDEPRRPPWQGAS